MPAPYHGSCLCGEVQFVVDAEPIMLSCCHCSNCKKYTGTVFTTSVIFPPGSVTVAKGESLVHTFRDAAQKSGNVLMRRSCRACAAPLFIDDGGSETPLAVFYGALDDLGETEDGKERVPALEYYTKDRVAWVDPVKGAQQARTRPGSDD